jgi:N-acetylneuraminic acid mutarotase
MRKTVVLLFVLFFLTASCVMVAKPAFSSAEIVEDSWVSKAPMQQARAGLGVAAVNGKIYAIGGTTASGLYPHDLYTRGYVGTNEEYDPETDTWTTKASMPTPRDYFAIAAYGNKIYCIGGAVGFRHDITTMFLYSYIISGVNEVYDTVTDTWETKTPMPDVAMECQAHVVNGKIYVVDGSQVYAYDPENDSWATKTRMPKPYPEWDSSLVSAVVDNKIVVTFDFSTFVSITMPELYEQKVWIYDTETDSWSGGTSGSTVVYGGAAVATAGVNAPQKVYVLGLTLGHFFSSSTNQVYDLMADAWTAATAMPTRRKDFGVAVVDDVLYVIGGYFSTERHGAVTPVAVNEQYTPFGYGAVPPVVAVVSPENMTYAADNVSLAFTVNKPVVWMGYSLDGRETVTVTGNTTIAGLTNGVHNVTVYAKDSFENTGTSETISFSVNVPFPTALVVAAVASVAVIGAVLAIYFKKHKKRLEINHAS